MTRNDEHSRQPFDSLRSLRIPFDIAALQRMEPRPAPLLGQHTDEILAEVLGMDSGAIGRLHDSKVVAGPAR